jgi:hypothetical protein
MKGELKRYTLDVRIHTKGFRPLFKFMPFSAPNEWTCLLMLPYRIYEISWEVT